MIRNNAVLLCLRTCSPVWDTPTVAYGTCIVSTIIDLPARPRLSLLPHTCTLRPSINYHIRGSYFNVTMGLCFLIYLVPLLGLTSAQCYSPDGSLFPDNRYMPCISTNGVDSMCCLTNTTIPQDADTCLPSGQCSREGAYYRDFCTDKTWRSPNCLSVCIDTTVGPVNLPDLCVLILFTRRQSSRLTSEVIHSPEETQAVCHQWRNVLMGHGVVVLLAKTAVARMKASS